jgi:predicted nucleic acid-binding protein
MELAALLLLDTSFLIALENLDDPRHATACRYEKTCIDRRIDLILHWGVVMEVLDGFARLSRRAKGLEIAKRFQSQEYLIAAISDDIAQEALSLYVQRSDKEWGLTDCTSFVLMQRLGISQALTADQHFVQAGFRALLLEDNKDD